MADNFRVEGFFSFRKLVVTPVGGCPHARKADDEEAVHREGKRLDSSTSGYDGSRRLNTNTP